MSKQEFAGVYQLENGYWGFRYTVVLNGKRKEGKKTRNEEGKPFKTQKQAAKAREQIIAKEKIQSQLPLQKKIERKRVKKYFKNIVRKEEAEKPLQLLENKIVYGKII